MIVRRIAVAGACNLGVVVQSDVCLDAKYSLTFFFDLSPSNRPLHSANCQLHLLEQFPKSVYMLLPRYRPTVSSYICLYFRVHRTKTDRVHRCFGLAFILFPFFIGFAYCFALAFAACYVDIWYGYVRVGVHVVFLSGGHVWILRQSSQELSLVMMR